ncbi:Spy/CpxP family protein refolding chaperone [Microbulbifer sp. SAOS-129_SWC]|uniref:Spy/CpxP family protein refolding chaperone n=1 Tax=Microbulbifer sp. SAOS-129_SWC TaxID=3145235 RepID=UPI00321723A5
MNSWKLVVACLGLAGILIALPGQAGATAVNYQRHEHSDRFDKFWMTLEAKLELTKDQKEKLKAYRESTSEERKQLKEQSKKLHKQIKDALESGADQSTLDNLGAEWGKVQVKRMALAHKYQNKFKEMLNDEQKAKLEKFKSELRGKWHMKHGDMDDEED